MLVVCCLTSQQQASVSQGRICSDNFTCCHTEIEVADQTFYLTQSQYTDTGQTSPSADPITPGGWQGSHWFANFEVTGMTRPRRKRDSKPGPSALEADALTTRPTRRLMMMMMMMMMMIMTMINNNSHNNNRGQTEKKEKDTRKQKRNTPVRHDKSRACSQPVNRPVQDGLCSTHYRK